jgi:hypothetical protein
MPKGVNNGKIRVRHGLEDLMRTTMRMSDLECEVLDTAAIDRGFSRNELLRGLIRGLDPDKFKGTKQLVIKLK